MTMLQQRNNVVLFYIDVPYDIKYNDKQLDGMDEAAADTLKQVIQTYIDKNGLNSNIKDFMLYYE